MIDIAQRAIERNSMIEIQIRETDEFIKLGQALKLAGVIQDGLVKVNGETELQRGKKIHDGDLISYNGETVKVSK